MKDHILRKTTGKEDFFITKGNFVIIQKSTQTYIKDLAFDEYFREIAFIYGFNRLARVR